MMKIENCGAKIRFSGLKMTNDLNLSRRGLKEGKYRTGKR